MHQSQYNTVDGLIKKYFSNQNGKTVYDIGSFDINGNHKPSVLQHGFSYVGVDIVEGPNVDLVIEPYNWSLLPDNSCDYIISGSCLEHVEAPWLWAKEVERCLKPGGFCVIILPVHITEHRYPVDCYRILPDGLKFIFTEWAQLECVECSYTKYTNDSYFVGRKRGGVISIPEICTEKNKDINKKNSIIIPTYKSFSGLQQCINSIKKTTDMSQTDVWIVCNGCSDEAVNWAKGLGSDFHLLVCPEALGYTRAVNIGLMAAQSDNVILLNDDVMILDWGGNNRWVEMLTDPLKDKSIAITGSTIDWWAKDKPFMVFFCVAIRREVVKEIGYLDEIFNPGCGEDADFCLKVQQKGYRILQVPEQVPVWGTKFPIYHIGNTTCCGITGWDKVTTRNTAILEQRYPRTDEDRQFQISYSSGLQNYDLWKKKP